MITKKCPRCSETLPATDFHGSVETRLATYCKPCVKEKRKEGSYAENIRNYEKQRYQNLKGEIKEKNQKKYHSVKDGKYYLFLSIRGAEAKIGYTNNTLHRYRNLRSAGYTDVQTLDSFEDVETAKIISAILHKDFGFSGFHKKITHCFYNKATDSNRLNAHRIYDRYLKDLNILENKEEVNQIELDLV